MTNFDNVLSVMLPSFLIAHSAAAVFFGKFQGPKARRKGGAQSGDFSPECAIFIPCKGICEGLEENLSRFFAISYPNYDLYFAVESENDPAAALIRKKIENEGKGKLVVSEQTKTCGQKNLNLVRAIDEAAANGAKDTVLVFADSDVAPEENWLYSLIAPLKNENVTVTSGFRWLYSKTNGLGSQVHSFQNYVLFALFVVSAKLFNMGLWGGSMAIRKSDYDKLNVRERWLETSVDDLSLAEIVVKNKKKMHFCFDCISDDSNTIKSYSKAEKWFVRQVQYLKYHNKVSWLCALFLSIATLLFFVRVGVIAFSAAFSAFGGHSLGLASVQAPLCFLGGIFTFALMFGLFASPKRKGGKFLTFVLYSPISLFNVCLCVVKTAFINVIDWSGYRYFMKFCSGKVWKVEKI